MNTLKGVNKQIVEINYTRDDYVQKAILIINPDKNHLGQNIIKKKANSYIDSLNFPITSKSKKPRLANFLKTMSYVLLGAAIMAVILYII